MKKTYIKAVASCLIAGAVMPVNALDLADADK